MSAYDDFPTGPSSNYAQTETNIAYLFTRFGQEKAQEFFGFDNDILEGVLGRYSRGKHAGKLRGFLMLNIVKHGGWIRGRGVTGRGIIEAKLCTGWGREITTLESWMRP